MRQRLLFKGGMVAACAVLAGLLVLGALPVSAGVAVSSISLSGDPASLDIGDTATLTALVAPAGTPLAGATVTFTATSGPNAGRTGLGVTDSSGIATFTFSSGSIGTDTWSASFTPVGSGTQTSNDVTVEWTVRRATSNVFITKIVNGTWPAGTVFEVTYTCEVPADPASNVSGTLQFDHLGRRLGSDGSMAVFTAVSGTHCTVTETANGGASSVSYLCSDIPRGNTCRGLLTTGFAEFTVGNNDGSVDIDVRNEMESAATTTPPVVVQPVLTG